MYLSMSEPYVFVDGQIHRQKSDSDIIFPCLSLMYWSMSESDIFVQVWALCIGPCLSLMYLSKSGSYVLVHV